LALTSPELSPWMSWPAEGTLHCCFATPEGRLAISIRLTSGRGLPGAVSAGARPLTE